MDTNTQPPDDPAVAALRQVADTNTTHSIKQTLLACLLIRSALRPPIGRRRPLITATAVTSAGLAIAHWHLWSALMHLLH
jgi:hypothetical protein